MEEVVEGGSVFVDEATCRPLCYGGERVIIWERADAGSRV